jgi:hypothetical protein
MLRHFIFFFLGLMALRSTAFAQREQLGIRYEQFGSANFSNPTKRLNDETAVSASSVLLNGSFRTLLDKEGRTLLTSGIQYRFTQLSYDNYPKLFPLNSPVNMMESFADAPATEQVHFVMLDLVLMHVLSKDWILFAALRPGLFSDFNNITSNHFRVEGGAFLDYRFENGLTLGFGAARSSNFGRVFIVPLIHLIYFGGESFMIDALLPQRAELWYYPNKTWELGINLSLTGSQYRLGNELTTQYSANQFGFANATASPIVRYNLFHKLYLSLEAGYTFIRRAEQSNSDLDGEARFIQQFNPKQTWFFRTGFQVMY